MLLSLPVCLEIDENLSELKPKEIYVANISLIFEKNNKHLMTGYKGNGEFCFAEILSDCSSFTQQFRARHQQRVSHKLARSNRRSTHVPNHTIKFDSDWSDG